MPTRVTLKKRPPPAWDTGLSQEQQDITADVGGVRFVAACPGGGKTRVLVQSIVYLINEKGVHPREVLAFTFTRQAAEEMRNRLELALGPVKAGQLECCTMHSFFYKVFRSECQAWPGWSFSDVTLIDKARGGKKKLYRQIAKELDLNEDDIDFGEIRRKIGWWKNWGIEPGEAIMRAEIEDRQVALFYRRYEEIKWKEKLIDFEDMLGMTLKIFDKFPEFEEAYGSLYHHIFVDEYHDTSPIQNELVKRLNKVHGNLFLVCDPNQSIYGFRGANPDIVINYKQHFPDARMLKLTQNFRSKEEIVERSYQLIGNNDDSQTLGLTAFSEKPGGKVELLGIFENEEGEAKAVAQKILISHVTGSKWESNTILYRMNAQSRSLEEQFTKKQIPYRIVGASSFYQRREIQDLLAYLEFLDKPEPLGEAFERIYNKPNRFLGKAWYKQFLDLAGTGQDLSQLLSANYSMPYMRGGARSLLGHLRACQMYHKQFEAGDMNLSDLANQVLRVTKYREWLGGEDDQQQERVDNLVEFISTLTKFKSIDALFKYIELIQSKFSEKEKEDDRCMLLTVHKSKGIENKTIFVIGMNDGILPHYLNSTHEERRVCFVAVSRAMDACYLSSTKKFRGKDCEASIFLTELGLEVPSELPDDNLVIAS